MMIDISGFRLDNTEESLGCWWWLSGIKKTVRGRQFDLDTYTRKHTCAGEETKYVTQ